MADAGDLERRSKHEASEGRSVDAPIAGECSSDKEERLAQQTVSEELQTPGRPDVDSDEVPAVPRQLGDGATQVEGETEDSIVHLYKTPINPFGVSVEMDVMQMVLFVIALGTRMWRLEFPNSVVFDEVHYIRQVGWYLNRTFFFDHHPPLSKMYFALAGYVAGYNPGPVFETVGQDYTPDVPIWSLRVLPALCGSLLIPIVYQIMVELRMKRWTAVLAAILVLCENSFLTQSRLMMVESILLFSIAFSVLALLKFLTHRYREFTLQWWCWLLTLGFMVTVTTTTKYIGVMTAGLVLVLAFRDFWYMIADGATSDMNLIKQGLARAACLLVMPVVLYFVIFYIHLSILVKAGPTDNIMTSSFQASLAGGLAAITMGQPLYIAYGSQITLHRSFGPSACWLHSHDALYPIRYPDNRGSSHQQHVTCYGYKDANNWWFVTKPGSNSSKVADPPEAIKDGDIIQLYHGLTKRPLNSHDVAAPMTPTNMEVSCYVDHNISAPFNTLWKVEILNKYDEGDHWKTIRSQVRLVHVNTTAALSVTGIQLPDWGYEQQEVVTDRNIYQDNAIWNVEEHIYPKNEKEGRVLDRLGDTVSTDALIPTEAISLTFWQKFKELQMKMWSSRIDEEVEHRFSSYPMEWPTDEKNVAYWLKQNGKGNSAQIHLVGNLISWYSAMPGFILFVLVFACLVLARKRAMSFVSDVYYSQMLFVAELLIGGYALNYLPFYTFESTYFLYHYLPAVLFKLLFVAVLMEQIYHVLVYNPRLRLLAVGLITIWLGAVVFIFIKFFGISCGLKNYTNDELRKMAAIVPTWDFIMVD